MKNNKHIVCYSGGHSSALVAVEVAKKYGKENTILLNHDICSRVESKDIKRFKDEVSTKLDIPITYANHPEFETKDQFDVCIDAGTWVNPNNRQILCTNRLKTEPFNKWLKENYNKGDVIYYGFDENEKHRIQRRSSVLALDNYKSDYPLALWNDRTIQEINELEINPPCQYESFKHGNCLGCLKAGWQHWYIIFAQRRDLWDKAKESENEIGYSIHNDAFLEEKEALFEDMIACDVPQTEHIQSQTFWAIAKNRIKTGQTDLFNSEFTSSKPCECSF